MDSFFGGVGPPFVNYFLVDDVVVVVVVGARRGDGNRET